VGQFDSAIAVLNEGLEYMPDDSVLLYVLAAVHLLSDNPAECLKCFRKAFKQDPDLNEHFIDILPATSIPDEILKICKNQQNN
jgi:tetratricopeptide (TPR) repeat protein